MLPYWDETSQDSLENGIPWALTVEEFELDGEKIPNPLRSFVLPKNIVDNINGDNPNYSKPRGYETVRYPLSGLVGTDADRAATAKHNAQFSNYADNVQILNRNILNWLPRFVPHLGLRHNRRQASTSGHRSRAEPMERAGVRQIWR